MRFQQFSSTSYKQKYSLRSPIYLNFITHITYNTIWNKKIVTSNWKIYQLIFFFFPKAYYVITTDTYKDQPLFLMAELLKVKIKLPYCFSYHKSLYVVEQRKIVFKFLIKNKSVKYTCNFSRGVLKLWYFKTDHVFYYTSVYVLLLLEFVDIYIEHHECRYFSDNTTLQGINILSNIEQYIKLKLILD